MPQLLVLGILNYAIPFALFPIAAPHVASGIIGVINGMTPMTTVIVSQFWPGGEKATGNKIVGVLIGFAGAAILASPSFSEGGSTAALGDRRLPPRDALLRHHAQLRAPLQGDRLDDRRRELADRRGAS